MAQLGCAGQQDRESGRHAGDAPVEEHQGDAIDWQNEGDGGEDRHDLRGCPPCRGARAGEPGDHRLDGCDERRVERMGIRPANHVSPGMGLELAGDSDELEAVLRGQQGLRNGDPVNKHGKEDDRVQTTAAGHRDPP